MSPDHRAPYEDPSAAPQGFDLAGRLDRLGGILGVLAVGALIAGLTPGLTLPAWPAVTLGAVAVCCALPAGRPAWRGVAAFLGLLALLGGGLQIAGLWYVIFRFGG